MEKTSNYLCSTIDSVSNAVLADNSCKAVLSDKQILAMILKGCTKEYADFSIDEIINSIEGEPEVGSVPLDVTYPPERIAGMNTEDSIPNEGVVRFDILFRSKLPNSKGVNELIVNIEAQNDFTPGYSLATRGIFYCSRLLARQKESEFSGSHYEQIKKVYSIWICLRPSKKWEDTVTTYHITEDNLYGDAHEEVSCYDKMQIVLVCISRNGSSFELIDVLNDLFARDLSPEEKKIKLSRHGIRLTNHLDRGLGEMCNYSKGVFEDGVASGIEQGIKQGVEKGIEKGRFENLLGNIKALLNDGFSLEKCFTLFNVDEGTQQKIRDLLENESV